MHNSLTNMLKIRNLCIFGFLLIGILIISGCVSKTNTFENSESLLEHKNQEIININKTKQPFAETTIDCTYAQINLDVNGAEYYPGTNQFKVLIVNMGDVPLTLKSYEITDNYDKLISMNFEENIILIKEDTKNIILKMDQNPKKIKILTSCDSTYSTIYRPVSGWTIG